MSAAEFDAYHKWLGIPPHEQPPNHYRLLGISLFENDPDVIDRAADARMAHLRTSQIGPNASLSQSLLSEVAAARVCLLDVGQKAKYDAVLGPPPMPPPIPQPDFDTPAFSIQTRRTSANSQPQLLPAYALANSHRKKSSEPILLSAKIISGGLVGLILGYFVVVGILGRDPFTTLSAGRRSPSEAIPARLPMPQKSEPRRPKSQPAATTRRPNYTEPTVSPETGWQRSVLPPVLDIPKASSTESIPPASAPTPHAPQNPPTVKPPESPPPPLIAVDVLPPDTPGHPLRVFFTMLASDAQEILKLSTVAQQNEAHKEMIEKLNKYLKPKTWSFHFPILQVGEISSVKDKAFKAKLTVGPELLSNVVDKRIELGGGLIETNSIFEDDSLNEVGE